VETSKVLHVFPSIVNARLTWVPTGLYGRLGPKGLHGWKANNDKDRLNKMAAPQALTVPIDLAAELRGSIPKKITPAVLPRVNRDGIAAPVTFCISLLGRRK